MSENNRAYICSHAMLSCVLNIYGWIQSGRARARRESIHNTSVKQDTFTQQMSII